MMAWEAANCLPLSSSGGMVRWPCGPGECARNESRTGHVPKRVQEVNRNGCCPFSGFPFPVSEREVSMNSKKAVYQVPVPSTDFTTEAAFCGNVIRYGYRQQETVCKGGIRFGKVLATRTRAERCCTPWHIEGAYDTLLEVEGSPWVQEMRSDTNEQWRGKWETHHYMIYLDSAGCFEVIAESWEALPEEPGTWG